MKQVKQPWADTSSQSKDEQDKLCREDLEDIAHFYWTSDNKWNDLRKIITEMEEAQDEDAWERRMTDY